MGSSGRPVTNRLSVSKVPHDGHCLRKAPHSMTRVVASVRHPMMSIVGVSKALHNGVLLGSAKSGWGCKRPVRAPAQCRGKEKKHNNLGHYKAAHG